MKRRKKPVAMVCRTLRDGTRRCSVKRRRGVSGTATSVPAPAYVNPNAKCSCSG